jgi:hypothetical protein
LQSRVWGERLTQVLCFCHAFFVKEKVTLDVSGLRIQPPKNAEKGHFCSALRKPMRNAAEGLPFIRKLPEKMRI